MGAAGIRNTGDKVVAVDKIQIRGSDIPFTQWYPDTTVTASTFQKSLNHTGWTGSGGALVADATCTGLGQDLRIDLVGGDVADESICATQASGPVSLNPGQAAVIYFKLTNGTITSLDFRYIYNCQYICWQSRRPSKHNRSRRSPLG